MPTRGGRRGGALGGYVMAIVMRALVEAMGERGRHPRSLTVQFLRSPRKGPVTVQTILEREGRTLSSASARLEQNGELIALALATFSPAWEDRPSLSSARMPDVAPPGPREPVTVLGRPGPPPKIVLLSTMQPRLGDRLFSESDSGESGGWMGLLEERDIDSLTILILADLWFPTPWLRLDGFYPAPTVEMSVYFRTPLPFGDTLLLGRFETTHIHEGFFEEDGQLWTPEGTLVAQSRQLGLLMDPPS